MKFGTVLPSFSWPGLDMKTARSIKDTARRAEELGYESLWAVEHFVVAPGLYGVSWLSSLTVLAYAAAVTEKAKIGTGIIQLPLRNPIILAKELATLQYLSEGRFVLGVGTGWDDHEFRSIGVPLKERGSRTDEMIEVLRRLLTESDVTHDGRHYSFENITIDPVLDEFPELWVAGGGKMATSLSPDAPTITEPVLKRILGADAWLARASGNDDIVQADVRTIRRYLSDHDRDPDDLHYAHLNVFHLSDKPTDEAALAEQRPFIERMMGTHRSIEHLTQCYFVGSTQRTIDRIGALKEEGIETLIISPMSYDVEQLEWFAEEVIPHFK